MNWLRLWLPLSWIYGIILRLRHWAYDAAIFKSNSFATPIINVGNLSFGGTGKTPHIEYLIKLLEGKKVAVLSRGYGRKSKGFRYWHSGVSASEFGDEPLQIAEKFRHITVAVCGDRSEGIRKIVAEINPDVILLDDAFQHRKIKAGLNLLLTTYARPFWKDALVPAGTLRDIKMRAHSADAIICTKCPPEKTLEVLESELGKAKKYQKSVFYSRLTYSSFKDLKTGEKYSSAALQKSAVCLMTGIANPQPLLKHLQEECAEVKLLKFPDHHHFEPRDFQRASEIIGTFASALKCLVITEKDAVKFPEEVWQFWPGDIRVLVISLEIKFWNENGFNEFIRGYLEQGR